MGLFASWESLRARDGPKRRRPDSNLVTDDEARFNEKLLLTQVLIQLKLYNSLL